MAEDIVGRLVYLITGDNSALDKALKTSSQKIQDAGKAMRTMGRRLTMGLTLPLIGAGVAALKFASDIETQQVAFATLLGDVERGTKLFQDLKEFSAETPLQLKDITQGAQKLLAFGTAAEDVQDRLRMLGDLAMGNAQKLGSMVTAFGKIQTRGKATMEELNMVIDAGVPILAALADGFGVSQEKLFEMVSAGEVKFPDFQKALEDMTGAGGQFEGMMANIAETTAGKFSTAVDNVKLAAADLVESLLPVVNDILASITEGAQAFTALDESTKRTILTVAGIAAAAGPAIFIIGRLTSAVGLLTNAFILSRTTNISFMAALNVNPIFLAITAITALTAGILILIKRTRDQKAAQELANKATEEYEEVVTDTTKAIGEMTRMELGWQKVLLQGQKRKLKEILNSEAAKKGWYDVAEVKERLIEVEKRYQAIEEELRKTDENRIQSTEDITESQKLYEEKLKEVAEAYELIELRASVYGDEIDVVEEKTNALRDAIDDLLESGLGFTSLSPAIQGFKDQLDELNAGVTEDAISESELRRRTWKEDLDWQIYLEGERTTMLEEAAEREKAILADVDEYKKELDAEERERDLLKLQFASDMATATGDIVSGMFDRMSQAAGENQKVQKSIARAQAIASKAFAVFQAIINTKVAIANALATVPFPLTPVAVAFAKILGVAQIAAILAAPIPKFAKGVNFVVPPGFENDSFPMMAETGEEVKITPKDEVAAGGAGDLFHITVNFAGKTFYDEITRATRNRQIIIDAGALHES